MIDIFTGTQGLIFDCDGTLLDSMPVWNEFEDEMQRIAGKRLSEDELVEVRAASISESARLFHEKHGVGTSTEDVMRIFDETLLGFYQNRVEERPGVHEVLEYAAKQGIACTVVTSSPRKYVEAGLRRCGLYDFFVEVCTTDELNMSKQEPYIYQHAMDVMGSDVSTTWGIDDAVYAIRVMDAMGMRTIAAYDCDETGTYESLEEAATVAIRSFRELQ